MEVPRRTIVRAGVTSAWTVPLVLTGVPAHAFACSQPAPSLSMQSFVPSVLAFPQGDGSVSLQPAMILTNNGPGSVTILQAAATPLGAGQSIRSLDIEVELATWGEIQVPAGAATLTLAAPAPQVVIAAGEEVEFTFRMELLGVSAASQQTIRLTLSGQCGSSAVSDLLYTVQLPDPED